MPLCSVFAWKGLLLDWGTRGLTGGSQPWGRGQAGGPPLPAEWVLALFAAKDERLEELRTTGRFPGPKLAAPPVHRQPGAAGGGSASQPDSARGGGSGEGPGNLPPAFDLFPGG